jgi:hypothetical protein
MVPSVIMNNAPLTAIAHRLFNKLVAVGRIASLPESGLPYCGRHQRFPFQIASYKAQIGPVLESGSRGYVSCLPHRTTAQFSRFRISIP